MPPVISVIIPVYNAEKYLDRMLQDIVYGNKTAIEIILVDDGSCDESLAVCDQWQKRYSFIHVMKKNHSGPSAARNAGLRAARGEYIIFLDADDEIRPGMLDQMAEILDSIPSADMALCGYKTVYEDAEEIVLPGKGDYEGRDALEALFEDRGFFSSLWNKMFRREVLFKDGGPVLFDEKIMIAEDTLFLSKVLSEGLSVRTIKEPLYEWRRRDEGLTGGKRDTSYDFNHRALTCIEAYRKMALYFQNRDAGFFNYSLRIYLGILRDALFGASFAGNEKAKKKLMAIAVRDIRCYPVRTDRDILFSLKYRTCLAAAGFGAPAAFLKKLREM